MDKNTDYKKDNSAIIINDIVEVSPDRNRKDVGKLKQAIERAECIQLPNRVRLYDLYHDVVTIDGHLSGVLQKRTDAVANKEIRFVDKDGNDVEEMRELMMGEKFCSLIRLIMDSVYWGISGVEFIAGDRFDYHEIPRKHIRPEQGVITKSQYDYGGTPIDSLPFVWTIGHPKDLGILLRCSMYALYKRSCFGDFAQYVEIFGQPVRIVTYDAYDTRTKDELRKILEQSGSSLTMMLPKQANFSMLDGKTSNGNGDLQQALIRCCNEEMSVAVLGNSETTTSSQSSGYAQAEVHSQQQMEITRSDMKMVQQMLNSDSFIAILRGYGFNVDGGHFEFKKETDLGSLKARLDIDLQVSGKVPVADEYWYQTYGIPKPDNYEQMKAQQQERADAMQAALEKSGDKDSVTSGKVDDKGKGDADQNHGDDDKAVKRTSKAVEKGKQLYDSLCDFFGVAPL